LIPNGSDIYVTQENKNEYIQLYVKFLLEDSIKLQFDNFKKGFMLVANGDALYFNAPEELQLLVNGTSELNFEELEKGTQYDNGYTAKHFTIKYFWKVLHSFNLEQKKKFLLFATGSDRAPIGGLLKLKLIIVKNGEIDRLPTAMTCFNYLLLPPYDTIDKMRDMLTTAINNSTGFGLR